MIVRPLAATMLRLAFPLRSDAVLALTDNPTEDRDLRALQALTAGTLGTGVRAYVEAPFRYRAVSRFSDGSYGVLYAANSLVTAVRETAHHLARIYRDGNAPPMHTRRKRLALRIAGKSVEARAKVDKAIASSIYDPDNYRAAQAYGAKARVAAPLLHFDSVRNAHGGHCVGAFVSTVVRRVRLLADIALVWDGSRFVEEHEIRTL